MTMDIVRFEWRYHTRQVSFVAAAALFFLFGFVFTATGFGPDNIHVNSPYSIAESTGLLSLAAIFILAVFCANAVVRDRETQMEEIVFTTSVEKLPFLLGRFIGSFLAAFTAFSTSALGMLAASLFPLNEPDRIGNVNLLAYVWALLVIALPNLVFAGVLLFALSTVTRSVLASYAGSVLLYVLYFITAAMTNSPLMASSVPGAANSASLAALLDPFALSAFFEQTQNWLPAVRNTRLISLSGNFLLNRLLWTGASFVVLGFVHYAFSFRVSRTAHKQRSKSAKPDTAPLTPYAPVPTRTSQWASYVVATRTEIRTFLLTLPFGAMLLLWAALAIFEMLSDLRGGEYGSASYPTSGLLFGSLQTPLTLLGTILVIYTSAEMIWRERTLRFSGILHATPASNAVFVASKCTALSALIAALTLTALAGAAILQLISGWPLDPLALLQFGYVLAAPLILFACAAVFIQTLSSHKYLGMLIVVLLAVISLQGGMFGIEQRLLRYASMPPMTYSDLNGFVNLAPFHWFALLWSALAALLLIIATAAWRHTRARIHKIAAIACTLLFLATGAYIFYNTNILSARERGDDLLDWRAAYERTYKPLAAMPQPRVASMRARVDLFPEQLRYRVQGEYTIVNRTAQPVNRFVIAVRRDARAARVTVPAARAEHNRRFNQFLFTLHRPLQPGATTLVRFDVTYTANAFDGSDPSILPNGTYLMTHRAFPSLGYRAGYEIEDPRERRRRGLQVASDLNPSAGLPQHEVLDAADWVDCDVTVSTAPDQRVVAPGRLVREWEEGNRRLFHFRTDRPIPHQYTIASARYAVARETHDGVVIEIDYHPGHQQNVARMMRAAADTLRYCSENFSPYPHATLRLAEISSQFNEFSGFAQPGVVFFGENRGFLVDARDPRRLDLIYRRTAHEVAHQWFGYTLLAADAPGDTLLTESLTKYTELMALRKAYGRDATRELLTYELDRYLADRTGESDREPPLVRVDNQPYLFYRKGAIVFHAIEDLIGEAQLNRALRELVREQGGPGHKPTVADLLRHLRAVTPPQQQALVDEWLNDVVLYDFRIEGAQSHRLPDGRYEVTMRVHASKDAHPLRESIDIALFDDTDEPLYLAKHELHDGAQTLTITVAKEPLFASVDPYITRIDRNRFDNTQRIRNAGVPAG